MKKQLTIELLEEYETVNFYSPLFKGEEYTERYKLMKRNAIMEECRQLITPEIKRSVDLSVYVANRILDILEKQDKSQRDLAKTLGKSEAEISKWLQGTHNFTFNTVAKIEIALGEKIIDDAPRVKSKMCSNSK